MWTANVCLDFGSDLYPVLNYCYYFGLVRPTLLLKLFQVGITGSPEKSLWG